MNPIQPHDFNAGLAPMEAQSNVDQQILALSNGRMLPRDEKEIASLLKQHYPLSNQAARPRKPAGIQVNYKECERSSNPLVQSIILNKPEFIDSLVVNSSKPNIRETTRLNNSSLKVSYLDLALLYKHFEVFSKLIENGFKPLSLPALSLLCEPGYERFFEKFFPLLPSINPLDHSAVFSKEGAANLICRTLKRVNLNALGSLSPLLQYLESVFGNDFDSPDKNRRIEEIATLLHQTDRQDCVINDYILRYTKTTHHTDLFKAYYGPSLENQAGLLSAASSIIPYDQLLSRTPHVCWHYFFQPIMNQSVSFNTMIPFIQNMDFFCSNWKAFIEKDVNNTLTCVYNFYLLSLPPHTLEEFFQACHQHQEVNRELLSNIIEKCHQANHMTTSLQLHWHLPESVLLSTLSMTSFSQLVTHSERFNLNSLLTLGKKDQIDSYLAIKGLNTSTLLKDLHLVVFYNSYPYKELLSSFPEEQIETFFATPSNLDAFLSFKSNRYNANWEKCVSRFIATLHPSDLKAEHFIQLAAIPHHFTLFMEAFRKAPHQAQQVEYPPELRPNVSVVLMEDMTLLPQFLKELAPYTFKALDTPRAKSLVMTYPSLFWANYAKPGLMKIYILQNFESIKNSFVIKKQLLADVLIRRATQAKCSHEETELIDFIQVCFKHAIFPYDYRAFEILFQRLPNVLTELTTYPEIFDPKKPYFGKLLGAAISSKYPQLDALMEIAVNLEVDPSIPVKAFQKNPEKAWLSYLMPGVNIQTDRHTLKLCEKLSRENETTFVNALLTSNNSSLVSWAIQTLPLSLKPLIERLVSNGNEAMIRSAFTDLEKRRPSDFDTCLHALFTGKTLLFHQALKKGNLSIIRFLFDYLRKDDLIAKAVCKKCDLDGNTPLHYATSLNLPSSELNKLSALIGYYPEAINMKNDKGHLPLTGLLQYLHFTDFGKQIKPYVIQQLQKNPYLKTLEPHQIPGLVVNARARLSTIEQCYKHKESMSEYVKTLIHLDYFTQSTGFALILGLYFAEDRKEALTATLDAVASLGMPDFQFRRYGLLLSKYLFNELRFSSKLSDFIYEIESATPSIEGMTIERSLEMYEACVSDDREDKQRVKDQLHVLLNRIKSKANYIGVPKDEIEKNHFYESTERNFKELLALLEKEPSTVAGKSVVSVHLTEIARSSEQCATRTYQEILIRRFELLLAQHSQTLNLTQQFYLDLHQKQSGPLFEVSQDVHEQRAVLKKVGLLPRKDTYQDPFESHISPEKLNNLVAAFSYGFNPVYILFKMKKYTNEGPVYTALMGSASDEAKYEALEEDFLHFRSKPLIETLLDHDVIEIKETNKIPILALRFFVFEQDEAELPLIQQLRGRMHEYEERLKQFVLHQRILHLYKLAAPGTSLKSYYCLMSASTIKFIRDAPHFETFKLHPETTSHQNRLDAFMVKFQNAQSARKRSSDEMGERKKRRN